MSRTASNRFFPLASNSSGQTGWVHDHPLVYLLDLTDQVIIGDDVAVGTEALRVVGSVRLEGDVYVSGNLTTVEETREAGPNGAGLNVQVLNANRVLVTGTDSQIQLLDPNGASRDVTLPADNLAGLWYWIENTGALGLEQSNGQNRYDLVVKRAGGATVCSIPPAQGSYVKCTGATWVEVERVDRVRNNATYTSSTFYDDNTNDYVVAANDSLILIDSTSGIITVVLPAVATSGCRDLHICDWTRMAGTNKIVIEAQGGETINGVASVDMTVAGSSAYLHCDDTVWNSLSPVS